MVDTVTLPREVIDAALDRLLAERITPEDIERRIQREIENRIGTVSVEEAAKLAGWDPRSFRRLLRRKGMMAVTFAKTKQRLRVCDVQTLMDQHLIPLQKRRRPKNQPAAIAA